MSAAEPGLSPAQPPQKQPRVLSCVLCQRRKIKCDRTIPCANCVKANVTCTPSKPAPPRHRSRPRKDLQERLSRCEALLKQYSDKPETPLPYPGASMAGAMAESAGTGSGTGTATSSPSMAGTAQSKPPFTPSQASPASQSSQPPSENSSPSALRMTTDSGAPRFFDTHMFAVINDEIQAMKSLVEAEDPDGYSLAGGHDLDGEPPEHSFPASNCPSPGDEDKVSLDAVQTFKLWQIYLDRVNPLLKIIHAPTIQPYIVQAAGDITSIPLSYQALLLSIFSLACVSLSQEEMLQIVGVTHEQAVHKLFKDMFYALTRFNFLNRYNMSTLQTLIHVLLVQQCLSSGHSAWVLCGSLIRMAISMGYHRDGQALKLPPFETEMRRRIWWQIVANDLRLTTDCGLKQFSIPAGFDTKMPLNLNDADLFPDATGELQSREGPTEMAFMLVIYRFNQFFMDEDARSAVEHNILGIGEAQDPSNPPSLARNRLLISKLEEDLKEINQRYINPTAGNNHLAAHGLIPHMIRHLHDMLIPMQEQPEWGTEIHGPRDNVFKMVIKVGEQLESAYRYMSKWGFGWFMQLSFHVQYLTSLTSLLYHRPSGSLSDRAWLLLEQMYLHHPELHKVSHRQYALQAHFVSKAWDVREQAVTTATGQRPETPEYLIKLKQIIQPNTPAMNTVSKTSTPTTGMPGVPSTSAGQQHQQRGGTFSMPQHLQTTMDIDDQQQQQRYPPVEQFWSTPIHTSLFSLDIWGGGAGYPGGDISGADTRDYAGGTYYPNTPSF